MMDGVSEGLVDDVTKNGSSLLLTRLGVSRLRNARSLYE